MKNSKNIFIISDLLLFDEKRLEELGFSTFKEMNNFIINQWNKTVGKNDEIILMGKLFTGEPSLEELEEIIQNLNGRITMISYNQNNFFKKEEFKKMGFRFVWNSIMYNKEKNIAYCPFPNRGLLSYDIVMVDDSSRLKSVIQNKKMSCSAITWEYCPLSVDSIPDLYKNMKNFMDLDFKETESRKDVE